MSYLTYTKSTAKSYEQDADNPSQSMSFFLFIPEVAGKSASSLPKF